MSTSLNMLRDHLAKSDKGARFTAYLEKLARNLQNPDADVADDIRAMNDQLRYLKSRTEARKGLSQEEAQALIVRELSIGDVQTTPVLQDLSTMYQNDEYIGTRIMPVLPLLQATQTGSYWSYDQTNLMSVVDDTVGTSGSVNEITQGVTLNSVTLQRRALKERIDAAVQMAADAPVAAMLNPLLAVLDQLALNQESRIAAIAGAAGSYGANTAAIPAADRWNTAGGGDPGGAVDTAKAALWNGNTPSQTIGFCSLAVYNALRRNPVVLDQFKHTNSQVVSRRQLADFFEIDDLLVGAARQNTALEGVAGVYARLWPNVFGVVRVPRVPAQKVACFGLTLETPKVEQEWYVAGEGGFGSYVTQVAYFEAPVIVAPLCGYLLTTPI